METFTELTKNFTNENSNDFIQIIRIIQAHLPDKKTVSMENFAQTIESIESDDKANCKLLSHIDTIVLNIFKDNNLVNVYINDPTVKFNILMTSFAMLARAIPMVLPYHEFDNVDWAVRYIIGKHLMPITLDQSISLDQLTEHFLDATRIGRKGSAYEKQFPIPDESNGDLPAEFVQLGQDIWDQVGQHEQTYRPFKYLTYEIKHGNQVYYYITHKKSQSELSTMIVEAVGQTFLNNLEFEAYFMC